MENLCNYHQANHSKKTCPQWINSMNLVANRFIDECIQTQECSEQIERDIEEEVEEQPSEASIVLWDMFHGFNLAEEEDVEGVHVQRDYNLRSKGLVLQKFPPNPQITNIKMNWILSPTAITSFNIPNTSKHSTINQVP
jgi:hypothetical protein